MQYFVDASAGNDSDPGTKSQPWKTLSKVSSNTYSQGDHVYLKKGCVWRESLTIEFQGDSTSNPGFLGSYGIGDYPKILGSDLVDNVTWENTATNIWKSSTIDLGAGTDIGFIKLTTEVPNPVFGVNVAIPKNSEISLTQSGMFFFNSSDNTIHFYLDGTSAPNIVYPNMEIGIRSECISISSKNNVVISDVDVRYSSKYGIKIENSGNITIVNVKGSYIGGSWEDETKLKRVGDIISVTENNTNVRISGCNFSNSWENGVSVVAQSVNTVNKTISNFHIEYTTFEKCSTGVGLYSRAIGAGGISSIVNSSVKFCVFTNTGYGYSVADQNKNIHAIIAFGDLTSVSECRINNLVISENTIDTYFAAGITIGRCWSVTIVRNVIKLGGGYCNKGTAYDCWNSAILVYNKDGNADSASDGLIAYNVVCNNSGRGLYVLHNSNSARNLLVYNNTFSMNGSDKPYNNVDFQSSDYFSFKYNIVYDVASTYNSYRITYPPTTTWSSERNCFYTTNPQSPCFYYNTYAYTGAHLTQFKTAIQNKEQNSIFSDPRFYLVEKDYHVSSTSPCVNSAINWSHPVNFPGDIDGLTQSSPYPTIGAYNFRTTYENLYYDSEGGDDANTGYSKTTPLKNITPVLNGIELLGGTIVNLRCGSLWRCTGLIINSVGSEQSPVIIQSYYKSELQFCELSANPPIISGAILATDWVSTADPGVWKYSANTSDFPGLELFVDDLFRDKVLSGGILENELDWIVDTSDGNAILLKIDDPSDHLIEVIPQNASDHLVSVINRSYVEIRGIQFEKSRHALLNLTESDHVIVDSCIFMNSGATINITAFSPAILIDSTVENYIVISNNKFGYYLPEEDYENLTTDEFEYLYRRSNSFGIIDFNPTNINILNNIFIATAFQPNYPSYWTLCSAIVLTGGVIKARNVVVSDNVIFKPYSCGILVMDNEFEHISNVEILDNSIYQPGMYGIRISNNIYGAAAAGSSVIVQRNYITGNSCVYTDLIDFGDNGGFETIYPPAAIHVANDAELLTVSTSISKNTIIESFSDSTHTYQGAGIVVENSVNDSVNVFKNYLIDNKGIGIVIRESKNVFVYQNYIKGNDAGVYVYGAPLNFSSDICIRNNTFYQNYNNSYGVFDTEIVLKNVELLDIRCNILYAHDLGLLYTLEDTVTFTDGYCDNNVLYKGGSGATNSVLVSGNLLDFSEWVSLEFNPDANSKFDDPELDAIPSGFVLKPRYGSPVCASGIDFGYTLDIQGNSIPAPAGTLPDIGCCENSEDHVPPLITLLGDNPVQLELHGTPYVEPGYTAIDSIDGDVHANVVVTGTLLDVKGTYTLSYNVVDSFGNAAVTKTRTIIVTDARLPVITLTGSSYVEVYYKSDYSDAGATAKDPDGVDITSQIVITKNLNTSNTGLYRYNYDVSYEGNAATQVFRNIRVVYTEKPVIIVTGNKTVYASAMDDYIDDGATAEDSYDYDHDLDITSNIHVSSDVVNHVPGKYHVLYNVVNSNGISAEQQSRTVFISDGGAPEITLDDSDNPTAPGSNIYYILVHTPWHNEDYPYSAFDIIDGDLTSSVVVDGEVVFGIVGTYVITYDVSDNSKNAAPTQYRYVHVYDDVPPILTMLGDSTVTIEAGSLYDDTIDAGATAWDAADGYISETIITTIAVDTSIPSTYFVYFTVTDKSNNTSNAKRTVIVEDTTPPSITVNGSLTVVHQAKTAYQDQGASAHDIVDGVVDVVSTWSNDTLFNQNFIGSYVRCYDATDSCGNQSHAERIVNIVDLLPPVITLNGSSAVFIQVGSVDHYTDDGATALDLYDGVTVVTDNSDSVDVTTIGIYVIIYTSEDSSHNVSTITRLVTVDDTLKPTLSFVDSETPSEITIETNSFFPYTPPDAQAFDLHEGDISSRILINNPVNRGIRGSYTVTYNVSDLAGNAATPLTILVHVIITDSLFIYVSDEDTGELITSTFSESIMVSARSQDDPETIIQWAHYNDYYHYIELSVDGLPNDALLYVSYVNKYPLNDPDGYLIPRCFRYMPRVYLWHGQRSVYVSLKKQTAYALVHYEPGTGQLLRYADEFFQRNQYIKTVGSVKYAVMDMDFNDVEYDANAIVNKDSWRWEQDVYDNPYNAAQVLLTSNPAIMVNQKQSSKIQFFILYMDVPGYGIVTLPMDNEGQGYDPDVPNTTAFLRPDSLGTTYTNDYWPSDVPYDVGRIVYLNIAFEILKTMWAKLIALPFRTAEYSGKIQEFTKSLADIKLLADDVEKSRESMAQLPIQLTLLDDMGEYISNFQSDIFRKGTANLKIRHRDGVLMRNGLLSMTQISQYFEFGVGSSYGTPLRNELWNSEILSDWFNTVSIFTSWTPDYIMMTEPVEGTGTYQNSKEVIDAYFHISDFIDKEMVVNSFGLFMSYPTYPAAMLPCSIDTVVSENLKEQTRVSSMFSQIGFWDILTDTDYTFQNPIQDRLVKISDSIASLGSGKKSITVSWDQFRGTKYKLRAQTNDDVDYLVYSGRLNGLEFLRLLRDENILSSIDRIIVSIDSGLASYEHDADGKRKGLPCIPPFMIYDILNQFNQFKKDMSVVLSVPSDYVPGDVFNSGYYSALWTTTSSMNYASKCLSMCFGNSLVRGIIWKYLSDEDDAEYMYTGVYNEDGIKPTLPLLKSKMNTYTDSLNSIDTYGRNGLIAEVLYAGKYEATIVLPNGGHLEGIISISEQDVTELEIITDYVTAPVPSWAYTPPGITDRNAKYIHDVVEKGPDCSYP